MNWEMFNNMANAVNEIIAVEKGNGLMALFNRPKQDVHPFNKEEIIDEIIDAVEGKYPDYCIIARVNSETPWDLLIIRSVMRETKYTVGNFGHERVKQERLQQVFAFTVEAPDIPLDEEKLETTASWTTDNRVVATVSAVMRRLEQQ